MREPTQLDKLPLVSVIIPTHKRPRALAEVLQGLAQQSPPLSDFEVIVVMDGPCAETQRLLESRSFPFELRWYMQPERGAPAARNRGVQEARGKLLVFLDDDIVPSPECLFRHDEAHRRAGRVVIGGLKPSPHSPSPLIAEVADWSQLHFDRCSAPGYRLSHTDLPDGNMSAWKEDILRAGGWDESFVGFGGGDDAELGLRLRALGLDFVFEPQALGFHYYSKGWAKMLEDRRQVGRAHRYFLCKHSDRAGDLTFIQWATGPWWKRGVVKAAGFAPKFLLAGFSSLVSRSGEGLDPRFGRALVRFAAKASGRFAYFHGFWEDREAAKAVWRQLQIKVPILAYHRVAPEATGLSNLTIHVREFERQMEYLARRGFRTVSLSDFCNWQTRLAPLPPKPAILTFDDGYAGFQEFIAPVLDRYNFRATIFLIAGKLGEEIQWEGHPPLKLMGKEEAATLARMGFDIQGHGLNHLDWTRAGREAVRRELHESARIIEEITSRPVRFFAYPFGRWSAAVRDLLEAANFAGACTIQSGRNDFNQDRFLLKRCLVLPGAGRVRLTKKLYW